MKRPPKKVETRSSESVNKNLKHRPRPHLALSIVGGAKNFHMDGRKKETFKVKGIEI